MTKPMAVREEQAGYGEMQSDTDPHLKEIS